MKKLTLFQQHLEYLQQRQEQEHRQRQQITLRLEPVDSVEAGVGLIVITWCMQKHGYYHRRASSRQLLQPVQTFIYGNNSMMHASRANNPNQCSSKLVYLDISSNIQQGRVVLSSFKHVSVSKQQQPMEEAHPIYLYKSFCKQVHITSILATYDPSSLDNLGVVTNFFGWL